MLGRRLAGLTLGEWLAIAGASALVVLGVLCIASAAGWHLFAWRAQQTYLHSADAARARRALSAAPPAWMPGPGQADARQDPLSDDTAGPSITSAGPLAQIDLLDAGFVFLDPPERGARARFSISLHAAPGAGPIGVVLPAEWTDDYAIAATSPDARIEVTDADGASRVNWDSLPSGEQVLSIDVTARGDSVQPPIAQVVLATGELIGTAHPRTLAPQPRPGRISALRIPRLNLTSAVVPTAWEPPAFVVGELRQSANVGQGNAILVGHVTGAAGAVFGHLAQVRVGDTIVASSRGLEYTFAVSAVDIRPGWDSTPTAIDGRPRLTLMTCTGTWDPLGHDYSDRLWVTAEPIASVL